MRHHRLGTCGRMKLKYRGLTLPHSSLHTFPMWQAGWYAGQVTTDGWKQRRLRLRRRKLRDGIDCVCGGYAIAESAQVIRGALRVGGGGEDGAVVVLQNFQPVGDIGGVILARLKRQFEIGAEESGAQFGDEFLLRVAFIAPALAAEVAVKARRVLRPVRQFMRERGVIALGVAEGIQTAASARSRVPARNRRGFRRGGWWRPWPAKNFSA